MILNSKQKLVCVILLSALCFLPSAFAQAQTEGQSRIDQLREQIDALEAQAKQFKSNIASEQAKRNTLQREITILKNQISSLEAQLAATGKKIDKTKLETSLLEATIFDTTAKIHKQRLAIGQLMLFLNRQDNEHLLATLLKTQSISDFYQQTQYVENVNNGLTDLIQNLNDTKDLLEGDKRDLDKKQQDLEGLQQEQEAKKGALKGVTFEKADLLQKTKGTEAAYQKRLVEIQRQEAEFYTELRKLENSVVAGGLYIVHVTAPSVPPRGSKIFTWPYEAGSYHITQGYGMTPYARRGAYGGAGHNGIDIASGYGSEVHPIGPGEVIAFGFNSGFGNWVAIEHANKMVSIYGHFSSFAGLTVGSKVDTNSIIGYEGTTGNSTGSHVHLSIYKDFFTYEKNGQLYFNYFDGSVNPLDYLP